MRSLVALTSIALVTSGTGCNVLFDIQEREPRTIAPDAGSDSFEALEAGDPCAACPASPFVQCLEGVCHDHRDPGAPWAGLEHPQCTALDDGRLTKDKNTGLVWEATVNKEMTTAEAEAHCASLSAEARGGFTDWVLPTRVELMTLADFSFDLHDTRNSCAVRYPSGAPTRGFYCGRSVQVSDASSVHVMRVQDGAVTTQPAGIIRCRPRCVHATRPNAKAPRFVVTESGNVYDSATDLTWMKLQATDAKTKESFAYLNAVDFCERTLVPAGWRVPTLKELQTLIDERTTESIDRSVFPGAAVGLFWSSTSMFGDPKRHYVLAFSDGGHTDMVDPVDGRAALRCVHGGRL